jgi:hypothetical protein
MMRKIKAERAKAIVQVLTNVATFSGKDELKEFAANGYREELAQIQTENFEILLDTVQSLGLTYLHVGERELCGCEGICDPKPWPAIWRIAEIIGVERSCGNSDQTQISNSHIYFGKERVGAWHVIERRRLTKEEEKDKKFNKVTEYFGKRHEVPVY